MEDRSEVQEKSGIRWDDITIENQAAWFPEDLRDGFRWLKTYCREECARDVHRLHEEFKKVGIHHDQNTWSKIMRGMWNRTGNGPRPTPVLSVEKLARAIEALRTRTRAEALQGRVPFVMTPTAKEIFDYIDARRAPDRVNRFGVIIGPTGSSKTATFKEYALQRNHGSTRWFEAPETGAVGEFISRWASDMSVQTGLDKKREHLLKTQRAGKCVIIDNCQDLYRPEWRNKQPAFSFLRRIQDETGCTVILSITPTFERVLQGGDMQEYFEQFEGRSGGRRNWLRLPPFPPEEDVLAIAQAFGLKGAKASLKELVKVGQQPGRIRILFEVLQEAKVLANAAGEDLTMEHVRDVMTEAA